MKEFTDQDIERIEQAIEAGDVQTARSEMDELHPADIAELYYIVSAEKMTSQCNLLCSIQSVEDVFQLIDYVDTIKVYDRDTLFKIMLLVNYCRTNAIPFIPYRTLCRRLYWSVKYDDKDLAKKYYDILVRKIDKFNLKHDIQLNETAINKVQDLKTDFFSQIGASKLGVFGSLSIGEGNEYSDLDLLVVFPDAIEPRVKKHEVNQFLKDRLEIPFDAVLVTEQQLEYKLSPSIKRSVRFL